MVDMQHMKVLWLIANTFYDYLHFLFYVHTWFDYIIHILPHPFNTQFQKKICVSFSRKLIVEIHV